MLYRTTHFGTIFAIRFKFEVMKLFKGRERSQRLVASRGDSRHIRISEMQVFVFEKQSFCRYDSGKS